MSTKPTGDASKASTKATEATKTSTKPAQKLNFVENFVLSGTAALIAKTVAAPIERVKLMIQNQGEMLKQGLIETPYKGVVDCTLRTFKYEGMLAFWRGNMVNCIRYFPTQALNFAFKDKFKLMLNPSKADSYAVGFSKNVISGSGAGATSLFFVYSLDYARTRLANDAKEAKKAGSTTRQYDGMIDVYKKTMKSDGVVGLYRGFVISCVGIVVYRGFYFGLYDTLKPIILGPQAGPLISFCLGYGVTVVSGLISYPIDTIRRRMMMTSGQAVKYKGSWDCFRGIVRNEGSIGLMRGASANILRGVAGAGVLAGFDDLVIRYVKIKERRAGVIE